MVIVNIMRHIMLHLQFVRLFYVYLAKWQIVTQWKQLLLWCRRWCTFLVARFLASKMWAFGCENVKINV